METLSAYRVVFRLCKRADVIYPMIDFPIRNFETDREYHPLFLTNDRVAGLEYVRENARQLNFAFQTDLFLNRITRLNQIN